VIASFRVEFGVPFCAERDSHAAIDTGLVDGIRREYLSSRNGDRIESEVRIKAGEKLRGRLREFLPPMIQSTAADEVDIDWSARIGVNHRIQCHRPHTDITSRKPEGVQFSSIDIELIKVELAHQPDVRIEIESDAAIEIPARVESSPGAAYSLSESAT